MKISIIVPIYSVEEYIERCARSLFEQDYENIEYIFVNDCTPDKSIEILERVIKLSPDRMQNIQIIHNDRNRGLSYSRHKGLLKATGTYIQHIDSDDWVETDMISTLVAHIKKTGAEIIGFDYLTHEIEQTIYKKEDYSTNSRESFERLIQCNGISPCIWGKIIKKDLYYKALPTPPPEINLAEDWYTTIRLFNEAQLISYVPKALYHYNRMNVTAMTLGENFILKRWKEYKAFSDLTQIFLEKNCSPREVEKFKLGILGIIFYNISENRFNPIKTARLIFPNESMFLFLWKNELHWGGYGKLIYLLYLFHLDILVKPLWRLREKFIGTRN